MPTIKPKKLIYSIYTPNTKSSSPSYCKLCNEIIEPGELAVKILWGDWLCLDCGNSLLEEQKWKKEIQSKRKVMEDGTKIRKVGNYKIIYYPADRYGLINPVYCKRCGEDITVGPRAESSPYYKICVFCFLDLHGGHIEKLKTKKRKKNHAKKNKTEE